MPRVVFLVAMIMAAGLLKGISPAPILSAWADSSAKSGLAESYIADFFRATVETAVNPQSEEYATIAVKGLLVRAIALNETARFMLGPAWPTDNNEVGRRFQEQFRDFVAETVTRGLRANPRLALDVKSSRTRPDGTILVASTLALPSGNRVPLDWRVAENPDTGTLQIIDITVAGVGGAIMLRTMAEATLAETDIDGLIPRWRAALVHRAPMTAGDSPKQPTVTSP